VETQNNPVSLRNDLEQLSEKGSLVFAAMVCERLLPNFMYFEKEIGSNQGTALRTAVDFIWNAIAASQAPNQNVVESLIHECEQLMPDSEKTTSIWTSSAIDAVDLVCSTLEGLSQASENLAMAALNHAIDSVDMYIQFTDLNGRSHIGPEEEQFIAEHVLMQRELNYLKGDFLDLKQIGLNLRLEDVERLRFVATSRGGNLQQ